MIMRRNISKISSMFIRHQEIRNNKKNIFDSILWCHEEKKWKVIKMLFFSMRLRRCSMRMKLFRQNLLRRWSLLRIFANYYSKNVFFVLHAIRLEQYSIGWSIFMNEVLSRLMIIFYLFLKHFNCVDGS